MATSMMMHFPIPKRARSVCVDARDPIVYPCVFKNSRVVGAFENFHVRSMHHIVCQYFVIDILRTLHDWPDHANVRRSA